MSKVPPSERSEADLTKAQTKLAGMEEELLDVIALIEIVNAVAEMDP